MSTNKLPRMTRRRFLKETGLTLAAAGAAPVISAPFVSRALADTNTLSIVQWSHFVPEYDKWFDNFAKDWGAQNKIDVTVDHIPVANVAARAAAEASAGSGHDLFGFNGAGGAHLYRKFLIDVGDLVKSVEKKYGKVSTIGRQIGYNLDDKTWSAFPDFYINFPSMYRKSMWDEIGMKPDTWDNVRIGGAKLKAKGHPVGISLGHSNDPNTTWRGLLWSFGGALQDAEGKNVVLDSKETVEAVKFVAALYKEAMTSDVLSWNDASNNQYIDSGVGSYIINPISAYRTAQKLNKKVGRRHFRHEAAERPGAPDHGRRVRILRHLEVRQEQGRRDRVPQILRRSLARSLQGERRIQQPLLRQSGAEADADPVERSDVDAARQAGDPAGFRPVVRHPRLSGAGYARHRRNLQRLHHPRHDGEDGDGFDERRRFGQVGHAQCEAVFKKWAGKT